MDLANATKKISVHFTVQGESDVITTTTLLHPELRLLPTLAGGLREKIRTCAGFNKIPTNYVSEESLINGVYDRSIV